MHRLSRVTLAGPEWSLLLIAAPLVLLAGCGDDLLNPGGETSIQGIAHVSRAADPGQAPVFGIGLGLEYASLSGAPGLLGTAQAQGVVLEAPYPNPVVTPEGKPAKFVVRADSATAARVEIWSENRGFPGTVTILETSALKAGANLYQWDGVELGSGLHVPNGVYKVRVTLTGSGETVRLEQSLIVNRPFTDCIALDAFHTFSDGDGRYAIYDVAVGTTFTRTGNTGQVLGSGRLADRVTLFTDDVDFISFMTVVEIGPGDLATVDVPLVPRLPVEPRDPSVMEARATTGPERPQP